jgi:cathepsin X/AP endonuclease-2
MPINDTDTCWPVKTPILYTLNSYGKLKAPHGRVIDAMMSEIYANGPITCGVSCPEDFVYKYRGGVFRDTTNDTEIDHGARK